MSAKVSDDLHHCSSVDFVVALDILHQVTLAKSNRSRRRLFRAPPRPDHRAEAIGRTILPARCDEPLRVHGLSNCLESEAPRAPHHNGFLFDDLPEKVEPPQFWPLPRSFCVSFLRRVVRLFEVRGLRRGPVE